MTISHSTGSMALTGQRCIQFALVGLLSGVAMAANAQSVEKPLRFVAGIGITAGGEELATAEYTDGTRNTIKSGELAHAYVGAEYRFTQALSAQVNVGYHVVRISADNGGLTFSRIPVEVLGHYALTPQWRLGGGLRLIDSAEFKGTRGISGSVQFKPTIGVVVETEYMMSPSFGVKVRGVSESYTTERYGDKLSSNHIGLYGSFYF